MFETFWMGQERRIEGDRALPGQVGGAAHVYGFWRHERNLHSAPLNLRAGLLCIDIRRSDRIVSGGIDMNQTFTAVVKNDGGWWIGWVEEVPGVNCQERSRDELLKTLRVTLMEALEMNRADARDAGGKGYEELSIVL